MSNDHVFLFLLLVFLFVFFAQMKIIVFIGRLRHDEKVDMTLLCSWFDKNPQSMEVL